MDEFSTGCIHTGNRPYVVCGDCLESSTADLALKRELVEALRSAKDRVLTKERLAIEALITRAEATL